MSGINDELTQQFPTTSLSINMTGGDYLAPLLAPREIRQQNYYSHGTLLPLGKFRKAHELYIIGSIGLRTWLQRISTKQIKAKELALEQMLTVVGQTSRGAEGYTAHLLSTSRLEIKDQTKTNERSGWLWRLFK